MGRVTALLGLLSLSSTQTLAWQTTRTHTQTRQRVTAHYGNEYSDISWRSSAARAGVVAAAAVTVFAPTFAHGTQQRPTFVGAAHASVFKQYGSYTLDDKLAVVPVFTVVNHWGNPYTVPMPDGNSQIVMFLDFEEAEEHMFQLVQAQSSSIDVRIQSMGLDMAWSKVRTSPQETGMMLENGEPRTISYRLMPISNEADRFLRVSHDETDVKGSPIGRVQEHLVNGAPPSAPALRKSVVCFYARGLTIMKHGQPIKPLFFSQDDLTAAWADMRAASPDSGVPEEPTIEMHDVLNLLVEHHGHDGEMADWGFVPSQRNARVVKEAKAKGTGKSRLNARAQPPAPVAESKKFY